MPYLIRRRRRGGAFRPAGDDDLPEWVKRVKIHDRSELVRYVRWLEYRRRRSLRYRLLVWLRARTYESQGGVKVDLGQFWVVLRGYFLGDKRRGLDVVGDDDGGLVSEPAPPDRRRGAAFLLPLVMFGVFMVGVAAWQVGQSPWVQSWRGSGVERPPPEPEASEPLQMARAGDAVAQGLAETAAAQLAADLDRERDLLDREEPVIVEPWPVAEWCDIAGRVIEPEVPAFVEPEVTSEGVVEMLEWGDLLCLYHHLEQAEDGVVWYLTDRGWVHAVFLESDPSLEVPAYPLGG